MKPAVGLYVPLPLTVAVPTVVPPVVQVVGAVPWGPNTVTVMVPVAFVPDEAASVELMALAAIAVPALPVPGPVAVSVGDALPTTVSDINEPQVEVAVLLLASPP